MSPVTQRSAGTTDFAVYLRREQSLVQQARSLSPDPLSGTLSGIRNQYIQYSYIEALPQVTFSASRNIVVPL